MRSASPIPILTSPSSIPLPLEILDLRHFTGRQLRTLLEEEAAVWKQRLRWNYTASTELLVQYLDSQILPGFVALLRGKVIGFCFCVYEGTKAVVGDVYVSTEIIDRVAVSHTLVRHLLEVLEASPETDRIEAQLLLYDPGTLSPVFRAAGFRLFPRLFLEIALAASILQAPAFPAEAHLELCRWNPGLYHQVAELIHAAYEGHIDSEINDQYLTLAGSLRFLHNIVRFPGCGTFDPECSWVLRDRRSGTLAAVLLCSRLQPDVAHVTQLCVSAAWRRRGLGAGLLRHAMEQLTIHGYHALTLTVSEANRSALRVYETAGFTPRLRFEALVLDKTVRPELYRIVPQDVAPPVSDAGGGFFAFARRKATPVRK